MNLKVAIVHDWLLGMRGGERCLEQFIKLFPQADLFTAFYDAENISALINSRPVEASLLNKLPLAKGYHRYLLPFYPLAANSLSRKLARKDREEKYDLVISISHCLAKNVQVPEGRFHLCYCLTPMRYLWDQYDAYFANRRIEPIARQVVKRLRSWDLAGVNQVDCFVAISEFVSRRIKKVYKREAAVIYPPVRTGWIKPRAEGEQGEGFLLASAFVPYKRIDAVVEAFRDIGHKLWVVGDGPERSRVEALAGDNVEFLGRVSDETLADLYRSSKALIFAAEEDFGMIPVEMQAAGRPVICLGKGGALETVSVARKCKTGIFFANAEPRTIRAAVEQFFLEEKEFSADNCANYARQFCPERFTSDLLDLLMQQGVLAKDAEKTFAAV